MLLNTKDILGIILFMVLPFLFAGIYLPHWAAYIIRPHKTGCLEGVIIFILTPITACVIWLAGLFLPAAPLVNSELQHYRFSSYTLGIAFSSFMINVIIRELIRSYRLRTDKTIIEINIKHKYSKAFSFLSLAILVYTSFKYVGILLAQGLGDLRTNVEIAFFLLVIAFAITITRKIHLTNRGISQFMVTTKWEDITGYRWGRPEKGKIDLTLKYRHGTPIVIPVPTSKKEQIETLLHNLHLPQVQSPYNIPKTLEARGMQ